MRTKMFCGFSYNVIEEFWARIRNNEWKFLFPTRFNVSTTSKHETNLFKPILSQAFENLGLIQEINFFQGALKYEKGNYDGILFSAFKGIKEISHLCWWFLEGKPKPVGRQCVKVRFETTLTLFSPFSQQFHGLESGKYARISNFLKKIGSFKFTEGKFQFRTIFEFGKRNKYWGLMLKDVTYFWNKFFWFSAAPQI